VRSGWWRGVCALVAVVSIAAAGNGSAPELVRPLDEPTEAAPPIGTRIEVYVTSRDGDRITRHPDLTLGPDARSSNGSTVTVDERTRYQTIAGFGASFLEAGLVTLNTLPADEQEAVLRSLFDPTKGAGFTVMKTVMGSTDFQSAHQQWFTYDDTPGDTALEDFSIARDLEPTGEITYIRRAIAAGGSFALQSSMDYPPDWMLTTVTDLNNQNVDPAYYVTLARYYARYLAEYEKQGVHISHLSLFNEPGVYMKISATDLNVLIRDHVGPLFVSQHVSTGIMATEVPVRDAAVSFYAPIVADPRTMSYIDVLGYHGYFGNGAPIVAQLHRQVPRMPLWMTEVCCLHDPKANDPGPTTYSDGDFWGNQILDDLEAGASAWIDWNMILDQDGGPWLISLEHEDAEVNPQSAMVHINTETHEVVYTPLYYYLSHFSRFIRPGAVRIGTIVQSGQPVRADSFRNRDGSMVTDLINSGEATTTTVRWRARSFQVTLPAQSITTLRWPTG
jgi:O-glycosyl hydrolase